MATDQTEQDFYRELDRSRHQPKWGCLLVVIGLIFVLGAAAYFYIRYLAR